MNPAVVYVGRVLDDPATTLTTNARFVLAELARHWNRRSETAWIGAGDVQKDGTRTGLAKTTGLSNREIRYVFDEIEASGYALSVTRPGRSAVWRFPALDSLDTPAHDAGVSLHLVHPSGGWTPARDAGVPRHVVPDPPLDGPRHVVPVPRHVVPGTPARGADEPIKEPFKEPAPPVADDAEALPYAVGQDSFTGDDTGPMTISDQRIADVIARHYSGELKVRRRPRRGPP